MNYMPNKNADIRKISEELSEPKYCDRKAKLIKLINTIPADSTICMTYYPCLLALAESLLLEESSLPATAQQFCSLQTQIRRALLQEA